MRAPPLPLLLLSLPLVLAANPTVARAGDGDDGSPVLGTAQAWVSAILDPAATAPAPTRAKPLAYLVNNHTRSCRSLKRGAITQARALRKLETCLVDTYRALTERPDAIGGAQWFEVGDNLSLDAVVAAFPARDAKAIRRAAKDRHLALAHVTGDGVNMDWYFAIDESMTVRAIWIDEEFFE